MYLLILVRFLADMIFDNVEPNAFVYFVLSFLGLLIVLGIIGLFWNIFWSKHRSEKVQITEGQNLTDQHFLGYFSIFILFALSFELEKVSMFCVFVFIILFVGIVYVGNKLFYINPLLNILGFNFYEISYIKEGEQQEQKAKMFYRGKLKVDGGPHNLILKNTHFSFVDKKGVNKNNP